MKILNKLFNWILYRNESHLDRNIRTTTNSFLKLEEITNNMIHSAIGHCCAQCYYGNSYTKLCEKYYRVGRWLSILLKKRSKEEDLKFAKYLDYECGKYEKENKTKIRDPFAQHALAKKAVVFKHKNDKRKKEKERKELNYDYE